MSLNDFLILMCFLIIYFLLYFFIKFSQKKYFLIYFKCVCNKIVWGDEKNNTIKIYSIQYSLKKKLLYYTKWLYIKDV